ncbi:hypothetical protein DH2020_006607 [Rehmannia glutinosa]|uniref:Lipase n=1 Tax=Rehmannia glutinosa TaxID=99300 RepID=A0ABR0XJP2_REHGL
MELTAAAIGVAVALSVLLLLSTAVNSAEDFIAASNLRRKSPTAGLCADVIEPSGFPCSEHTTQTNDGFVLGLQRVSSPSVTVRQRGSPVLLIHGLLMAGDAWFMDSPDQSLGFILANRGFDVWVGNVRGTRWSHGHKSLSERDKKFWDWSWQELALFDLGEMIRYIYSVTNSKVLVVGHSQGTIMSLAALTQPDIAKMVEAAALLCPISYLEHVTAPFVLRLVKMRLDEVCSVPSGYSCLEMFLVILKTVILSSNLGTSIMDMMCDGHMDCADMLYSITVIREGTFAMYDYGMWKNLMYYSQPKPPTRLISAPFEFIANMDGIWGNDALADISDVKHTLKELPSKPDLLYLENYGHIDFLLSVKRRKMFMTVCLHFLPPGNI